MCGQGLFVLGLRHGLPIVLGYVPVAIAWGTAALEAGFTPLQAICMSACVYSGAGQVLGVAMSARQTEILLIAAATLLINLRYFIMSASCLSRLSGSSLPQRMLTALFITDETFALLSTAPAARARLAYAAGIIVISYLSWVAGSAAGVLLSAMLPRAVTSAMGIALYALFIAIIIPGIRCSRALTLLVIGSALLNAGLSAILESGWSVVLTIMIAAGLGAMLIPAGELRPGAAGHD